MTNEEIIKELKEKQANFSLYSLTAQYKIDMKTALLVCKEIAREENCFRYYILLCPSCSAKIESGLVSKKINKASKKCFKCKKAFTVSMQDLEFVYTFVEEL